MGSLLCWQRVERLCPNCNMKEENITEEMDDLDKKISIESDKAATYFLPVDKSKMQEKSDKIKERMLSKRKTWLVGYEIFHSEQQS